MNLDGFFSNQPFPAGTVGFPEGEEAQGEHPLDPLL
jgi:hypothetical protein